MCSVQNWWMTSALTECKLHRIHNKYALENVRKCLLSVKSLVSMASSTCDLWSRFTENVVPAMVVERFRRKRGKFPKHKQRGSSGKGLGWMWWKHWGGQRQDWEADRALHVRFSVRIHWVDTRKLSWSVFVFASSRSTEGWTLKEEARLTIWQQIFGCYESTGAGLRKWSGPKTLTRHLLLCWRSKLQLCNT